MSEGTAQEATIATPEVPVKEGDPGSIIIRPTRAEAERDKDAFYDLLESVKRFQKLPVKQIAHIIGLKDVDPSTVWRRLQQRNLDDPQRQRILDHIFDDAHLLSGDRRKAVAKTSKDALYFAFLNHCDIKETSQDSARARIVGTYKLWRFSVEHEGEVVLGRLRFFEDKDTRAVKVEMTQRKKSLQGVRGTLESAEGYLFRVSHMHLMLLMDNLTHDVRMTIFPRAKVDMVGTKVNPRSVFQGEKLHIVHFDGFGLGIDGSAGFFSPVHLSLVDDADELAGLEDLLDVAPEGDHRIPDRVVAKLKRNGPLRRL